MKKALLLLLDSVGVGCLPDAADYGDDGAANRILAFRLVPAVTR